MSTVRISGNGIKFLKALAKSKSIMVEDALNASGDFLLKEAQERAPVVTGAFKRSLVKSRTSKAFRGRKIVVGSLKIQPVVRYQTMVERRHKIFRTLQKTKRREVVKIFNENLSNFLRKFRAT